MSDSLQKIVAAALEASLRDSMAAQQAFLDLGASKVTQLVQQMVGAIKRGNKIVIFGNGGSAADAQHVAGELVGRFMKDREPLPCVALSTDSSVLTCIGNDMGFEHVFERQMAIVNKSDVVVGISTSGNSANIVLGLAEARRRGAFTAAFTGRGGGKVKEVADLCLCVPCDSTPRIQEVQITVWHAICQAVEQALFP